MKGKIAMRGVRFVLFAAVAFWATTGYAVDEKAANALAKDSNCFKCHSVAKKKDAPSYKEIAAKYKGKADAEATLTKHITSTPMVKVDGKEEKHEAIKSKDAAEIKNLVQWILSR
jgi:cytochrome c